MPSALPSPHTLETNLAALPRISPLDTRVAEPLLLSFTIISLGAGLSARAPASEAGDLAGWLGLVAAVLNPRAPNLFGVLDKMRRSTDEVAISVLRISA